ncbi:hypothetical protein PHAVU_011G132801 [Phaseolus vulgaris]
MQPSPSVTPSITRSSKRHTRKIISINPVQEFITRNLIRSHPPLQSSAESIALKSPRIHQGPVKKLRSLHKNRLDKCVSTINTCKAKIFIQPKTSYRDKLIINQEILDKIRNRQTPKLSNFINNRRRSHQMHIDRFEKEVESSSVRHHGFSKKNQERFM